MYLIIVKIDGNRFIEEKNESNHLIFDLMQLHSKNGKKNPLKFGMGLKMRLKQ